MKSETETAFLRQNSIVMGMTITALLTSFVVPSHYISGESLLSHRLIEETTSSQPANIQLPQVNRANLIRSVRGKYSFVQTSSDEFAERKQIEIDLEG
jgi:hypothetical protein